MSTSSRQVFSPKLAGEVVTCRFEFVSKLSINPAETISTQVVTASVYSGVDASPSAILSGSATLDGTGVKQLITGGVAGTVYLLVCTVTTSQGQTLKISAYLVIESDGP